MIDVIPLPAFDDNYIWLLVSEGQGVAVDPGDAAALQAGIDASGIALRAILLTHHHGDHTGGVAELAQRHAGLAVYGPPGIPGVTHVVKEGDRIALPGIALQVLAVPGHTLDHVAYAGDGRLFCGDTLFGGGCGRVFEGTMAQMHASLQKLAALDEATLIYPAHEYTLSNLVFALAADPGNPSLNRRLLADRASREAGRPTLPSTLATERATNPFLRTGDDNVRAAASHHANRALESDEAVFAVLRDWKNGFRSHAP